jgi:hypothetical protein
MNSSRWLLFLLMASLVAYGQDANGRIEGRVANLASGQGLRGVELRVVEM